MPVKRTTDADQERIWPCVPSTLFGFRRITAHFSRAATFGQLACFLDVFLAGHDFGLSDVDRFFNAVSTTH